MHRDTEPVAGFLRVEEAEMLSELLASQGIESRIEGAIASALGPVLRGAAGGARLLVRAEDAERARELIATSGVFRGEDGAPVEILEREWAAPAEAVPGREAPPARVGRKTFLLYPVVVAVLVALATALCLVGSRQG